MRKLEITLLSARRVKPVIGWQPLFEFEDLLSRLLGAHIVAPEPRRRVSGFCGRVRNRLISRYRRTGSTAGRILLVNALTPDLLDMVRALPGWRANYDVVAGYITDSFLLGHFSHRIAPQFDHLFVSVAESAPVVRETLGVPVTYVPLAADVLGHGTGAGNRPIDVLGFGRSALGHGDALKQRFNEPGSGRLYLHSPFGVGSGSAMRDDRRLFWKLLRRSRISLCYDLQRYGPPWRRSKVVFPPVTARWFESMAAGCVVAGRRPISPAVDEMFDWPDALVELPEDPDSAVDQLIELVDDRARLETAHHENYLHMLRRHDWRLRLASMFNALGIDIPDALNCELAELAVAAQLADSDVLVGGPQNGRVREAAMSLASR